MRDAETTEDVETAFRMADLFENRVKAVLKGVRLEKLGASAGVKQQPLFALRRSTDPFAGHRSSFSDRAELPLALPFELSAKFGPRHPPLPLVFQFV